MVSKAAFSLPEKVKPVAPGTEKIYKLHLNRLAAFGVSSVEDILNDPVSVNETIEILTAFEDDDEKRKTSARLYYSSIFYVLYENPVLQNPKSILRQGFQRYPPSKTNNGEKWVSVEQFKKQ